MKTKFNSHKVIAAGIACTLLILACSVFSTPTTPAEPVSQPTNVEQVPVASNTPRSINSTAPVNTPESKPTDTPETPSCFRWDEITFEMAGESFGWPIAGACCGKHSGPSVGSVTWRIPTSTSVLSLFLRLIASFRM